MTPTLEEMSDFWQDVLHVRCKGDVLKAVLRLIETVDQRPNTSDGRFACALLLFVGDTLNALKEGTG
jgi:hypothetical protein